MAINPISGLPPVAGANAAQQSGVQKKAETKSGDFAKTLENYVGKVDEGQQNAGAAVRDLVSGKSDDILPVVSAVAEADMSFKLLVGVRNKVIEAYKQTMNMQI